jgi:hypothetical protein
MLFSSFRATSLRRRLMAFPVAMRLGITGSTSVAALLFSWAAFADDASTAEGASTPGSGVMYWHAKDEAPPGPSAEASAAARRLDTLDRPLLYLTDPRLPAPLTPLVSFSPTYTSIGAAVRPLAANLSRSGLVNELHLEVGVLERLAPFATAFVAPPLDGEKAPSGAFEVGTRVLLTSPNSRNLRIAVDGAFMRDFGQTNVTYAAATATYDFERIRFAGLAHAEHAFATGRDAVDLYVDVGTSVRVVDRFRIGAEYVVQELEDAWSHDAEGGARDFAGAAFSWSTDRVSFSAGPAFGLGGKAPPLLGRAVASVAF